MAAEPKKRKPQTLEGKALVRAMVTNKKLVAETNIRRRAAASARSRWNGCSPLLVV